MDNPAIEDQGNLKSPIAVINFMKKPLLLPFIFFAFIVSSQAQVGISVGWVQFDAPAIDDRIAMISDNSPSFEQSGLQFGVDYWFRLKQKRVEFLPELSYFKLKGDVVDGQRGYDPTPFDAKLTADIFQLHFNTQIYVFDFAGDCDCPTFSKDGDLFKKGLFVRLAPGLSYETFNDEITGTFGGSEIVTHDFIHRDVTFTLRGGVGLDIGISDFVTVTPIIQYNYTFPSGGFSSTEPQDGTDGEGFINSEITQLYFGLRLGLRFDELNKYGYR